MKREKIQINNFRYGKGYKMTNIKEIQGIISATLKTYIQINWKI
jgi:hypothetical protein